MIAVTADVHIHPFSQFATLSTEGINTRLLRTLECVEWMIETAISRGCSHFVVGGDLFHTRKEIPNVVLDLTGALLKKYRKKIQFVVLVGNHDLNVATNHTSLRALSGLATVVDEACVLDLAGFKVGFIPWVDDNESLQRSVEVCRKGRAVDVIAHLGAAGALTGSQDIVIPGHVDFDLIKGSSSFRYIHLGHEHKNQVIRESKPMIYYVGSPLQHSWGETGNTNGFTVVDEDGMEFIKNTISPRFVRYNASDPKAKKPRKGDYVDIIAATEKEAVEARAKVDSDEENVITHVRSVDRIKERLDLTGLNRKAMLEKFVTHAGVPEGLTLADLVEEGLYLIAGDE